MTEHEKKVTSKFKEKQNQAQCQSHPDLVSVSDIAVNNGPNSISHNKPDHNGIKTSNK